jgi:thiol:disulfide interchange protein DsbD
VGGSIASINYVLTPKLALTWLTNEAAALAHARVHNKPIVMDFTAEWCLPCREFDVNVFARPEVAALLEDFVLVKIDVTREDEDDTLPELKQRYGVATLPAVRLLDPAGAVVGRVDHLVGWEDFRKALLAAQESVAVKAHP